MKAYYYREYVYNEGLLLQRVSLQWRIAITEVSLRWRLTITESKTAMNAYYYRQ